MKKPAVTQVPIDNTIAHRWSGRAFDTHKAVSHEQVLSLLEAARWAPSCFGNQPWRFIYWERDSDRANWQKAYDFLSPGNQAWVRDAPLLVLVTADKLFSHNNAVNRWAQYDTGAAAVSLCLQATSMGLMAHQMGGFDVDGLRAAFAIPEQYTLMAVIAVGYQAVLDSLDEEERERELAERRRHPLGSLFFRGSWGNPVA